MKVTRGARAVEAEGVKAIEKARQAGAPRDDYDELPDALKLGRAKAAKLGHTLGPWKRRVYAPDTAATAHCTRCQAPAIVNLEHSAAPRGPAVTECCRPA